MGCSRSGLGMAPKGVRVSDESWPVIPNRLREPQDHVTAIVRGVVRQCYPAMPAVFEAVADEVTEKVITALEDNGYTIRRLNAVGWKKGPDVHLGCPGLHVKNFEVLYTER